MDTISYTVYIDIDNNNNNNTDPIQWIKIKSEKHENRHLLNIPYSPLIKISNFQDAIYKTKSYPQKTRNWNVLESIKQLYKSKDLIFDKTFLKEIQTSKENNFILHINYPESTTYNQLYFINFLSKHFVFLRDSVENNVMTVSTNKDILNKEEEEEEEELSPCYIDINKDNIIKVVKK